MSVNGHFPASNGSVFILEMAATDLMPEGNVSGDLFAFGSLGQKWQSAKIP
jgi:hypothetical protein